MENTCNGEWKNDCPYPECQCAKEENSAHSFTEGAEVPKKNPKLEEIRKRVSQEVKDAVDSHFKQLTPLQELIRILNEDLKYNLLPRPEVYERYLKLFDKP